MIAVRYRLKLSWFSLIAAAILALGLALFGAQPSQALSDTLLDDTQPIYLGIGHHTSFDGTSLDLGVYYDDWSAGRTINIFGASPGIFSGGGCRADPWLVGPGQDYAIVRLTVNGGGSITYRIKQENFCTGVASDINSRTAPNEASFVGRYQLPLGGATRDAETNKFKVSVHISFTSAVTAQLNNGYNPNVFFRVRAPSALVGALSGKPIGTRVYSNTPAFYQHRVEFGAPCSMTNETVQTFGVHDPDNRSPTGGPTYTQGAGSPTGYRPFVFYVEERLPGSTYKPLAQGRYNIQASTGVLKNDGTRWVVESTTRQSSDANGVSPNTLVNFRMQPDAKYRFVARSVHLYNFLQIIVPTDAIYGAIDCPRGTEVQPQVAVNPNPAVLGQGYNTTARVQNGGNVNAGRVNYTYRVWYDSTGNGTFGSGDVLAAPAQTGSLTIPKGATRDVTPFIGGVVDRPDMVEICAELRLVGQGQTTVNPASDIKCVPIGKYPQVQISGGDVLVRSDTAEVRTMGHQIGSRLYGSWVEYSIFAAGNVQSFSGGSLPAAGYSNPDSRSILTFANTEMQPGNFVPTGDLPFGGELSRTNGVWRNWPERQITGSSTIQPSRIQNKHVNVRNGNIRLENTGASSWSNLPSSYVVYARGSVQISDNITYVNGPFTSKEALPQLVIIADGDINIDPSVTRVDAWLVAGEQVATCQNSGFNPYYRELNRNTCNSKLRINGPVQAKGLFLRRTAGADGSTPVSRSAPAEVINFRSDAHLWAFGQASQSQAIRTETVKQLPPRF